MNASLVAAVMVLVGAGVFLITSRSLSRIVLGFSLLGHAAVLALLSAGGPAGTAPIGSDTDGVSDPLPQAFSLTAIVIAFGLTLFLLALAVRQRQLTGDDLVQDDVEDRRIARWADANPTDPDATDPEEADPRPGPDPGSARNLA